MTAFILLTLWCHGPLSPFLPAAYEPLLLLYGQLYPPFVVALVGAVVSAVAEYLNYYMYRVVLSSESVRRRVMSNGAGRAVSALFARWPFLAVWVCAWSPLPDWAARVLASHTRYSIRRYLTAVLAGRIPKFWFLAAVGMHWAPSTATIATIVVGSVVLTLAAAFLRRPPGRSRLAATGAVLSVVVAICTTTAAAQQSLGVGPVLGMSFERFGRPREGPIAFTFRRAPFGRLVRLERRGALRLDVTRHSFYRGGEHYGVWSFGLGLSVLPPAAGN